MSPSDQRRAKLKEWFSTRPIPIKEKSYISQLIRGRASFGEKAARRLEAAYDMGPGYLDGETLNAGSDVRFLEPLTGKPSNVEPGPNIVGRVPLISKVQAGHWVELYDHFPPGDAEEWLSVPVPIHAHTFALRVVGDSMTSPVAGQKTYPAGCIIVVEPDAVTDLDSLAGRMVVVRHNGDREATFKKLVRDGARFYLHPLNPQYEKLELTPDSVIVGVVVAKIEKE